MARTLAVPCLPRQVARPCSPRLCSGYAPRPLRPADLRGQHRCARGVRRGRRRAACRPRPIRRSSLRDAIARDPGCALAHAALARAHQVRARVAEARDAIAQAAALARDATPREQGHVEALALAINAKGAAALDRLKAHLGDFPARRRARCRRRWASMGDRLQRARRSPRRAARAARVASSALARARLVSGLPGLVRGRDRRGQRVGPTPWTAPSPFCPRTPTRPMPGRTDFSSWARRRKARPSWPAGSSGTTRRRASCTATCTGTARSANGQLAISAPRWRATAHRSSIRARPPCPASPTARRCSGAAC